MKFIKPSWLTHSEEKRQFEVYSCHVSPDGERLATGGRDCIVRIWSTAAIYNSDSSAETAPKQLCSISTHSGAVLAVRFSGSNRYLASGSDDKIVLIYERVNSAPSSRPVFGSKEAPHTETWRTSRRLAGHDNDVQDIGWSADSSILVSVGLDSKVVVWSGHTFEKLRTLSFHQSLVKGLTFDPANKYFATASDDRSIKIVRFTPPQPNSTAQDMAANFTLEKTITAPFQTSPLTTYFRRCSWSPDGSHIAAANATNGPVSSVAIINRGTWDSEINLIGHEGPVEVCAFAPRMFSREPVGSGPVDTSVLVTVIACAGQDKALSVWNTSHPRPLVITQDLATKTISDLAWSPDGRNLFATSLDGSIVAISFDEGDLGHVVGMEENDRLLQKFGVGRRGVGLAEGVDAARLEEMAKDGERKDLEGKMGELMMDGGTASNTAPGQSTALTVQPQPIEQNFEKNNQEAAENSKAVQKKLLQQKITFTREGKKRVAPLLISTGENQRSNLPNAQLLASINTAGGAHLHSVSLDLSKPFDGLPKGGMASLLIGNKRKYVAVNEEEADGEDGHIPKRTQTAAITNGTVVEPREETKYLETPEFIRPAVVNPSMSVSSVRLAVPRVRSFVQTVIDSSGQPISAKPDSERNCPTEFSEEHIIFEARNSVTINREPTRITVTRKSQTLWVDYVPKAVLLASGNSNFWCAACEDGSLVLYSISGRRIINPIIVEAQPVFLASRGWWLLCVTGNGLCHVWNVKTLKVPHPPVSVAPILDIANTPQNEKLMPGESITEAALNSDGMIIMTLTNGEGFTYSRDLHCWQRLTEAWWAVGSQYWDSTGSATRVQPDSANAGGATSATAAAQVSSGIIPHLERRTTQEVLMQGRGRFLQRILKNLINREGFEGFETQVSIAHLENRMAGAIALGAKEEFKQYLMMYVRRIGAEGLKGKVEEICKELMGDTMEDEDGQENEGEQNGGGGGGRWGVGDEIVGWNKRELLKGVILVLGKYRELQRITVPYAKMLGVMETGEE